MTNLSHSEEYSRKFLFFVTNISLYLLHNLINKLHFSSIDKGFWGFGATSTIVAAAGARAKARKAAAVVISKKLAPMPSA